MSKPKVLFVCLGNICRSPTAEAVFKSRARDAGLNVYIDSAGTGGWHSGDPPDPRAIKAGMRRSYDFSGQAARAVTDEDFEDFDYILAMDKNNLRDLSRRCPNPQQGKLALFLNYGDKLSVSEVPDPYYGGAGGFENVLDLIETASDGLVKALQKQK